jgi:flagellar biosynthesis protein FliQ
MVEALRSTAIIALPAVLVVAVVGVAVGIAQAVIQVQDQNVAFAPKLAAVAVLAWCVGPLAFDIIRALLVTSIEALPALAHA